jgi:serine/threonine-protein kinase RsbW
MTIVLRDHGRSFDPETVETPDITGPLKKRKIGGLGIYLIKSLMDVVRYEPLGEAGNIMTLIRKKRGGK